MIRKELDWINGVWHTENYQSCKKENFLLLDQYLKIPPSNILDIGCGLAWESRFFNEKYNSELWLLDGDDEANKNKSQFSSDASWHLSADDFLFYYPLSTLKIELDKLDTKNYHLLDCNNFTIPENIKFDLITSWMSCGFHYPVNTYKDIIKKHSHENTVVVMDVRKRKRTAAIIDENVEVLEILNERQKYFTCVLKL